MMRTTRGSFIDVIESGAAGDGQALDTEAIQGAIDSCAAAGGGTVLFPAGRYLVGSLELRSNLRLWLEPGAVVLASEDENDYPLCDHSVWGPEKRARSLFYGRNLTNIGVVGGGVVDGRGEVWWRRRQEGTLKYDRPHLVGLIQCRNVLLRDLTFCNAPTWTLRPTLCEDVVIDNIRIHNPYHAPNTDGINPDACRNVRISNCLVDVGDDCITLKSGRETDLGRPRQACENITISNCTLVHGHGGVVIGSEMHGSVRRVTISNCVFDGTDRGVRVKSCRGRGGVVEDLVAANLVMHDVGCPVTVNLHYGPRTMDTTEDLPTAEPVAAAEDTPRFRDFSFANIQVRKARGAAAFLCGLPESPLENMTFTGMTIILDDSPGNPGAMPADWSGQRLVQGKGILGRYLNHVRFKDVTVRNARGKPVRIEDSEDVSFDPVI